MARKNTATRDSRETRATEQRASESRGAHKRAMPSTVQEGKLFIPEHMKDPNYSYAWIAAAVRGQAQQMRVSTKMRQAWMPCLRTEFPELFPVFNIKGIVESHETHIVEGDLVLCKKPKKLVQQSKKEQEQENRRIMEGIRWTGAQDMGGAPIVDNSSPVLIEQHRGQAEFQGDDDE